jgi:hypothetical protein
MGVMLALAYTLVLLPALLAVFPLRPPRPVAHDAKAHFRNLLMRVGEVSGDHPRVVVLSAALFAALCLAGALQARFSHYALAWFDEDDPMRISAELVDQRMRGSMSLEAVIRTGAPDGVYDPEFLSRLERAGAFAEGFESDALYVGKAVSIVDILKEIHQALHGNDPAFHVLPTDRELIAQELLLFENTGADDLEQFVDPQLRTARLSMRAPFVDALTYGPFIEQMRAGLEGILGDQAEVEITGFMPVLAGVVDAVIRSMARSYVIALVVITPLMMLLLRDPRLGLLSMIPNLLPVIFTLGLMGWLGLRIDSTTMMIGAMVVGLAVDDTIHFMHKFRLYFSESGDAREAIHETLSSTGAALLFTSLVLMGGFFVFALGSMSNTRVFGLLAGLAALVALIADVVVGPALMVLATRREARRVVGEAPIALEGEPSTS